MAHWLAGKSGRNDDQSRSSLSLEVTPRNARRLKEACDVFIEQLRDSTSFVVEHDVGGQPRTAVVKFGRGQRDIGRLGARYDLMSKTF
jgi:hypothetical protein